MKHEAVIKEVDQFCKEADLDLFIRQIVEDDVNWPAEAITKDAKAKKKKLDPKAKVRNRGRVVFPAESPSVKDKQDHYPYHDEDQARNAIARSMQYSKAPKWYRGSLKSLQEAVRRKIHSKYPGIEIESGKKKKSDLVGDFTAKYAFSIDE